MVAARELSIGTLTLERLSVATAFFCPRCRVEKTSRLRATWVQRDGTQVVICNGCFGSLCAAYGGGR